MQWNFSHHHQHIKKMSTNNPRGYHHLYSSTLGSLFLEHQLYNHTRKPLLTNVGGMALRSMYTPEGGCEKILTKFFSTLQEQLVMLSPQDLHQL
jgi:hypothetical protein